MAFYCLPLLELKTTYNGSIIGVPLLNVCVSSREMCCKETEVGVMII